jgi:hypothetical protein
MSHFTEANNMLGHPFIGDFIRNALKQVFADGYSFHTEGSTLEIYIENLTTEKSMLFDAAMRVMNIEFSYPCGPTRTIHCNFKKQVLTLKSLLIRESTLEPDEDA